MAFADERLEEVAERCDLSRRAVRATRDHRSPAVVQAIEQEAAEPDADRGVSAEEARETEQHRAANDVRRKRRPEARRTGEEQRALERVLILELDAVTREVAEAGGDAVHGRSVCDEVEQSGTALLDTLVQGLRHLDLLPTDDDAAIEVEVETVVAIDPHGHRYASLVPTPCSTARRTSRSASARSVVARSPMPEENPLVVALAARLRPDDDLGQLGVERRLAEQSRAYVWAQGAEGIVALALRPVVDDHLVHGVEHVELEDALRPVRHEQGACVEPRRAQERRRLGEPGRLDDDVGADDGLLDRLDDADWLAERLLELPAEARARLGPPARHAYLLEVEEVVEHDDVRERRPARADVAEHLRVLRGRARARRAR